MATPIRIFSNDNIYHIYNRGVEKRLIFSEPRDYQRFLNTLLYYQQSKRLPSFTHVIEFKPHERERPFRIEILAYCLMPNHFHLLVRQTIDRGIVSTMSNLLNGYTKYFNTKYKRVGHLFQGRFRAVPVTSDEQLIHVVRYILLNPYVARLTADPLAYPYSSIREALSEASPSWCETKYLSQYFPTRNQLKAFITNYAEEARSRELIHQHIFN